MNPSPGASDTDPPLAREVNAASLAARLQNAWIEHNTSWSPELNRPMIACVMESIARHAAIGDPILDIGCGDAHMTAILADAGFRSVGLDVNGELLRSVKEQRAGCELAVGAIERLPFPDGSFELAYVGSVLQYADRPACLAEIIRVLRPGGFLITIENLHGSPVARAARLYMAIARRRYPAFLTPLHHLERREVAIYERVFGRVESRCFNLFTPILFAVACGHLKLRGRIPNGATDLYDRLHAADRWAIDKLPVLEHLAWHIVICARK